MQTQESKEWNEAYKRLKGTIEKWISDAMKRHGNRPFYGGHDECNYTASWPEFAVLTGAEDIMDYCKDLRDQLINWPGLYHGFYPDARWDIEHSVENWTVFVSRLAEADPEDEKTLDCLEDLAHHLGNWVDGIPDWFDWEKRRFISEHVGTLEVKDYPPYDFSTYWDARASELAMTMWKLGGDDRYLEFSAAFAGGWADHILAQKDLGYWLMLDADISDRERFEELYGEPPEEFHSRNINWIGECMLHMLHVYEYTGEKELVQASRKVIEQAPNEREGWKRRYQEVSGDTRYAEDIASEKEKALKEAEEALSQPLPEIVMLEEVEPHPKWWRPAARRLHAYRDEDGHLCQHGGPDAEHLMEACRATGKPEFGIKAMNLAAKELLLAASTLRDGREHGCNSRFTHAPGRQAIRVFADAGDVE